MNRNKTADPGYKDGVLPRCATLGLAFVPVQQNAAPRYESGKALCRGTVFPGLDLPLRNIVNNSAADTPQTVMMGKDFAAHDLSLYLDTHPDDQEAFELYKELLLAAEEERKQYAQSRGAVCKSDLLSSERYTWLRDPWPWDNGGRED